MPSLDKNKLRIYFLYFTLLVSGGVILVIEIAGARVLAPFYGSTIFVWSSLITITLGFLALGYFIGGIIADKYPKGQWFYFIIFLGGALALLLIKLSQFLLVFSSRFGLRTGCLMAGLLLFACPLFLLSMAGPFAIRLRSQKLEQAGHTSGIVFGVSTIGSLIGALLTGFYLIPNFFIPNIFIGTMAVIMIVALTGLLLEQASWRLIAICLLILILSLLLFFIKYEDESRASIIFRQPSFYGEIQVVEAGGLRCLAVNSSAQTCIIKESGQQALSYGRLITSIAKNQFQSGQALIIGLGGGILARDLQENFDNIDVVEIDPKIVAAAKEFFGYDDTSPQFNTYVADARNYLETSSKKYDLIIMDAFSGANPVPHLCTQTVFEKMRNLLSEKGVLLVNTTGRPYGQGEILSQSIFKTLNSVFPYLGALSTKNLKENPEAFGNIIFIAALERIKFPAKEESVVGYNSQNTEQGIVFTDAYNPIELLGLSIYEETQRDYQDFLNTL